MDIPVAAAAPWIALGVALGVLVITVAGLGVALRVRRQRPADRAGPVDGSSDHPAQDDLAGFLEYPPGTAGGSTAPAGGWVVLAPPAPAPEPAGRPAPRPVSTRALLAAMAVSAVLLLAAAAVAMGPGQELDPGARPASGRPLEPGAVEARLAFGGVVLEPHAVGVTATYPGLRLTGRAGDLHAHLDLPTWNCLAAEAPADPAAAGCRRSVPEYSDLAEPALEVTETFDGLRIAGHFSTVTAASGASPEPTGRTYELVVTVVPGERSEHGWLAADAVLHLGDQRTETNGTDPAVGVNVLRYGDR